MIEKTFTFERGGNTAEVYTLTNRNGLKAEILTYGGRLHSLFVPDRYGNFDDVIVGYREPWDHIDKKHAYFGAVIGRYCNRIGGGKFTLGGRQYSLPQNDGNNTLHGGFNGFDKKYMKARTEGGKIVLSFDSPDGEEGFPGNLHVEAEYELTDKNELAISFFAECDEDTPISLTNHAYFNLGGEDVLLHRLKIYASHITEADGENIPTGKLIGVRGTPFEFDGNTIGERVSSEERMIRECKGYDLNYCLDKQPHALALAATAYCEESGRAMDCYTTMPGLQLYTSNVFAGTVGKKVYKDYAALCLEAQSYPNSPNCPSFPSCILKAGETYCERVIYAFRTI